MGSGTKLTIPELIAKEIKAGTFDPVREASVPSIPVPQANIDSLTKTMTIIKSILDQREGVSGSVMDANLTLRDLISAGTLALPKGGGAPVSVSAISAGTGSSSYDDPRPVFSTPPAVTALSAQGAFKSVILDWVSVDYQNFSYFEIWRSGTNSLGTAALIGTSTATLYNDSAVLVGATYYYWVRAVNAEAVAGPYNAVGGTSAALLTIGNTDLGPLTVTADKLSQGTYPNINLVPNGSAEDGLAAWIPVSSASAGGTFLIDSGAGTPAGGSSCFRIDRTGSNGLGIGCRAFPVIPGETYSVKVKAKGSSTAGSGLFIQMLERGSKPATGYIGDTATMGATVDAYASITNIVAGVPFATAWTSYESTYVVPAGVYWAALTVYNWTTGVANGYFDDMSVGRQITASFLAAGSIAVGTAAIQNGAIVNAMIGTLAVDNAKIANLDGAKINAGTVTAAKLTVSQLSAITADLGAITAGSVHGGFFHGGGFTNSYAWPASGQVGFHLSSSGLLLGNFNDGQYFQVNANGQIFAPGLTISGGTAVYSGSLSAASGSFSGSLSSATGTFSGALSAASLTLAGQGILLPVFASSSSSSVPGTAVTAASVNPGSTGSVAITCTAEFVGSNISGGSGESGGDPSSVTVPTYTIKRNGTAIASWTPWAPSSPTADVKAVGQSTYTALDTPGGSAVYTLVSSGGGIASGRCTMLIVGVNR